MSKKNGKNGPESAGLVKVFLQGIDVQKAEAMFTG